MGTTANRQPRRPAYIRELERIATDPAQSDAHRLRAAASLARAMPKPRSPPEPKPPRRELTPVMAKHLVALLAAVGTSWEEWVPSATWEELAQAGYDRADVIKVGIDPELVRHGPARSDFVVVYDADED